MKKNSLGPTQVAKIGHGYLFMKEMNKHQRIPKWHSKMGNPGKSATQGTKTKTNKGKSQRNMCWTPLCANKHK